MREREAALRSLLEAGKVFKLVCGAGNENLQDIERLATIYTLAGANVFDVAALPPVVQACVRGIAHAERLASEAGPRLPVRPFIKVSVGVPGDHHVRKAVITDACVACNRCVPVCPTDAIPPSLVVTRELCIGCGNCEAACPPKVAAIRYEHDAKGLSVTLPACLDAGAELIELHAAVPDDDAIMAEWRTVVALSPHLASLCLDRQHLSTTQLVARVREARAIAGDRLIVQADGVPMSGGQDDWNTTLQTIATADVLHKHLTRKEPAFRRLPVLLSGGTNSHTGELARRCGVPFAGVAIGTHARKLVKGCLEAGDDWLEPARLGPAVGAARELVARNLGPSETP